MKKGEVENKALSDLNLNLNLNNLNLNLNYSDAPGVQIHRLQDVLPSPLYPEQADLFPLQVHLAPPLPFLFGRRHHLLRRVPLSHDQMANGSTKASRSKSVFLSRFIVQTFN
jgi:hypothetical protein